MSPDPAGLDWKVPLRPHLGVLGVMPNNTANYIDEDGDLVAVGDAEDLAVYLSTRPFTNLLELCVTAKGDYASYSTGLPR